ncbi:MAG: twin-arginine translocase TatA/TatE family subunit [Tetrasphaera sp.]
MDWSEWVVCIVLVLVIIGPQRMPEYAAKLARGIRQLRLMADGARDQLREQMGPEFDDINWRQYDPRQYDPRKIVRDALREPLEQAWSPVGQEIGSVRDSARALARVEDLPGHAGGAPPEDDEDDGMDFASPMRYDSGYEDGDDADYQVPYDLEAT